MIFRRTGTSLVLLLGLATAVALYAQAPAHSSSSSVKQAKKPAASANSGIDDGVITNGVYRNKTLAISCKIPPGWVLRTDEMNAPEEKEPEEEKQAKDDTASAKPPAPPASSAGARVLLAAFSRPPEARAEDVNASILIAAESAASYTGLKDAAQYFGPLTEVAKAQGFTIDEDPYEFAVGTKTLVRGDFHKDVGTRVMRQSTLAILAHGYAISVTVIGGTEDEVEELIDGLMLGPSGK